VKLRPLLLLLLARTGAAQELEPRALVNTPIGTNFVLVATGYLYGSVLLEPALPLEDGQADLWTLGTGYIRAINFFGLAGKVGFGIPFARGTWRATFNGADTSATRTGFGDPSIRLSVSFLGAPALSPSEFGSYRQGTVAGITMLVILPVGQYYPDRLINLGSNRWSVSTRFGVSQVLGKWMLEAYAGATLYTRNDDFFGGKELTQEPLFEGQLHFIRFLGSARAWLAGSIGHASGARSTIDGVEKSSISNTRLSLSYRQPLGRHHSLKLAYINGLATRLGGDFDTFQVAWQYAW